MVRVHDLPAGDVSVVGDASSLGLEMIVGAVKGSM